MIHQASDVVEDVVDEANTSSILSASKLCRSSSFLAMPPPQGMTMRASGASSASPAPGANLPSGIKRRSESFLMLPNDGNDGDSEDDDTGAASAAQARRRPPEDCSGSGNSKSNRNSNESAQRPTVIVSPDTNAVAANGESGAIPDLNLNEQTTAESQGGDVDDDDDEDEDEYFLQDLSPEACESIVDGIFGGGGSLNVVGGGGGDAGTHSRKTTIGDDEDGDEFASLSMMMLPPLKKMRTDHRTGPAGSSIRATVPARDEPLAV
jgi:hypothetical protein